MTLQQVEAVEEMIEPWFFFSLVWSVGGTTDIDGRDKFSQFLRGMMNIDDKVR